MKTIHIETPNFGSLKGDDFREFIRKYARPKAMRAWDTQKTFGDAKLAADQKPGTVITEDGKRYLVGAKGVRIPLEKNAHWLGRALGHLGRAAKGPGIGELARKGLVAPMRVGEDILHLGKTFGQNVARGLPKPGNRLPALPYTGPAANVSRVGASPWGRAAISAGGAGLLGGIGYSVYGSGKGQTPKDMGPAAAAATPAAAVAPAKAVAAAPGAPAKQVAPVPSLGAPAGLDATTAMQIPRVSPFLSRHWTPPSDPLVSTAQMAPAVQQPMAPMSAPVAAAPRRFQPGAGWKRTGRPGMHSGASSRMAPSGGKGPMGQWWALPGGDEYFNPDVNAEPLSTAWERFQDEGKGAAEKTAADYKDILRWLLGSALIGAGARGSVSLYHQLTGGSKIKPDTDLYDPEIDIPVEMTPAQLEKYKALRSPQGKKVASAWDNTLAALTMTGGGLLGWSLAHALLRRAKEQKLDKRLTQLKSELSTLSRPEIDASQLGPVPAKVAAAHDFFVIAAGRYQKHIKEAGPNAQKLLDLLAKAKGLPGKAKGVWEGMDPMAKVLTAGGAGLATAPLIPGVRHIASGLGDTATGGITGALKTVGKPLGYSAIATLGPVAAMAALYGLYKGYEGGKSQDPEAADLKALREAIRQREIEERPFFKLVPQAHQESIK